MLKHKDHTRVISHTCVDRPNLPCDVPECRQAQADVDAAEARLRQLLAEPSAEKRNARIHDLVNLIGASVQELYRLVAPTPDETAETRAYYCDYKHYELIEEITDQTSWEGMFHLAMNALDQRESKQEQEEVSK